MMIGEYPCCNGSLMIEMPDRTPAYAKDTCDHCGAKVWHYMSRVEPMSWTEKDFLASHEINEATKQIKSLVAGQP